MAVFLANTMHNNTNRSNPVQSECVVFLTAMKKPESAKGNAKTVCANFTNDKYFDILFINAFITSVYSRILYFKCISKVINLFFVFITCEITDIQYMY